MTHRIDLDAVRVDTGPKTWITHQRARCGDHEERGNGGIIVAICKKMMAAGMSGPVEIWRGATPVFLKGTVEYWAALHEKKPEGAPEGAEVGSDTCGTPNASPTPSQGAEIDILDDKEGEA